LFFTNHSHTVILLSRSFSLGCATKLGFCKLDQSAYSNTVLLLLASACISFRKCKSSFYPIIPWLPFPVRQKSNPCCFNSLAVTRNITSPNFSTCGLKYYKLHLHRFIENLLCDTVSQLKATQWSYYAFTYF